MITIAALTRKEVFWALEEALEPCDVTVTWREKSNSLTLPDGDQIHGIIIELSEEVCAGIPLKREPGEGVPIAGLVVSEKSVDLAQHLGIENLLGDQDHLEAWVKSLEENVSVPKRVPLEHGLVVAVWGPPGSPGTTSLAITLAGLLSELSAQVVLIDGDTYSSSVAQNLNLSQTGSGLLAACRMARVETVEATALRSCMVEYTGRRSRFQVMTGLLAPEKFADIDLLALRRVFEVLRREGYVIVIDLAGPLEQFPHEVIGGPLRNGIQRVVLENADHIVAVTRPTATHTTRFLRQWPLLSSLAPQATTRVLMNAVLKGESAAANEATYALWTHAGIDEVVSLPNDRSSFVRADSDGVTIGDLPTRSPVIEGLRPVLAVLGFTSHKQPQPATGLAGSRKRFAVRLPSREKKAVVKGLP